MADRKEKKNDPNGASGKKGGGKVPRWMAYSILFAAAGFAVVIWSRYVAPGTPAARFFSGETAGQARIGGPFTLVNQDGGTVTQADFRGRYMLVYFGYTFCPDICPTTLSNMAEALDMIGDKAAAVTPVFISMDPARDTPEQMKMYIKYFDPRLVGLTGSQEQVAAVVEAYKAYSVRADEGKDSGGSDDGEYLIDHSASVYLMGSDGEFVFHFNQGVSAEELAKRLEEFL